MPQNTPMKRQFTTIDGRTLMSNLPQHWGGNDWAITGVDNPLPVGNYVQTQAGVWIPQKGSDDGAADVQLTGSKVELFNQDVTIPAGSSFNQVFTNTLEFKLVDVGARNKAGRGTAKKIRVIGRADTANWVQNEIVLDDSQTLSSVRSEWIGSSGQIQLDNADATEQTFRLYVAGVK